jgi:hypothetical protein
MLVKQEGQPEFDRTTVERSGKLVKKQKAVMFRLKKMGIISINNR